jgi:hypothetical protein
MTRTHVLVRCPAFEDVRREVWNDPTTGAFTWPRSIAALLGNPGWDKRLLNFLENMTIGNVGPEKIEDEIRRVITYEEWCNLVKDSESEDDDVVTQGRNNEARGTIIVRPPLRAASGKSGETLNHPTSPETILCGQCTKSHFYNDCPGPYRTLAVCTLPETCQEE